MVIRHIRTFDEENALQYGFHHVYPINKFENERFPCNMEYLYTRSVNLRTNYRQYERKKAKEQIKHKLTSEQLNDAGQLHSLSNSFQNKAELEYEKE